MKISLLFFALLAVTHSTGLAQERFDYSGWAYILGKYVDAQGRVDYQGILKNPPDKQIFDRFIESIEKADLNLLAAMEHKAFWINAYNAITMNVILDKYPVKDIRFVNFGRVWNVARKVAGGELSLGHIEHKILRPLSDPRIHFAINCASGGCPKLPQKPFYPEMLDEQLDFEARRFIQDADKVRLDRERKILHHSSIFSWFKEDFIKEGDLKSYMAQYMSSDDREFLKATKVSLKALDYDWNLNKQ
jgi:hypothetical protein